MSKAKVDFASVSWEEPAMGVRSKAVTRDGRKLRLVEFTSEFVEQDWCFKGHIGYVLDGELEITFSDGTERFTSGDGIFLIGREEERHKAKVTGSIVRLLLVEDA